MLPLEPGAPAAPWGPGGPRGPGKPGAPAIPAAPCRGRQQTAETGSHHAGLPNTFFEQEWDLKTHPCRANQVNVMRKILTGVPLAPALPSVPGFPWDEKEGNTFSLTKRFLRNYLNAIILSIKWSYLELEQSVIRGVTDCTYRGSCGASRSGVTGLASGSSRAFGPTSTLRSSITLGREGNEEQSDNQCTKWKQGCDIFTGAACGGMSNTIKNQIVRKSKYEVGE